ncbi:TetR/AcrR family transcriptional regulator [Gordonia sp. PDNC005]|uniref:TetR/AcrR family transcriptional regulator n=1 Tax=unclassified Gordonia (in: high G+C Gram-positive bacteria) TaxID=2657482 RepID=UPI0019654284|nr:TetR/AcrR family transcriptional regulator [Gordonia sp. PDNC005]QRY62147.1 TetR/AcrR family transcriptional regulator [Gordonia sp. PDNC005]
MAHVSTADRSVQFVEAAAKVIAEQGVASATTRRIAEAAGAPLASLHYCFRDKDSLFHAVFEHLAEEAARPFADVHPVGLEAAAERLIRRACAWIVTHPDYALAQLDLHLWMCRNRPDQAVESVDGYLDAVVKILTEAEPGIDDVSVKTLASILTAGLDGLVVQWAADRDTARVDAFVEMLCAGLPSLCATARAAGSSRGQ